MPRPSSRTLTVPSVAIVHVDPVAVTGHRLVDGVVDDLADEVVEAADVGGADVHARPAADCLEALEDLDATRPCNRTRRPSSSGPERRSSPPVLFLRRSSDPSRLSSGEPFVEATELLVAIPLDDDPSAVS